MKTSQALTAGVILVLGYSLYRKATAAGQLNFFPDKVRGFDWDGMTPILTVGLGVQNTSNQSFTVNSIAGNVYANGYLIGNIGYFTPQTISPNSQGIIVVDVRLMLIGVVNDIIQAITEGHFQQELQIKANSNVDNLQVPINFNYKIGD